MSIYPGRIQIREGYINCRMHVQITIILVIVLSTVFAIEIIIIFTGYYGLFK